LKTGTLYRKGRLYIVAVFVLLWFCVLAGRLVQLHILDRPKLLGQLEGSRKKLDVIEARRGMIRDRNGIPLAISIPLRDIGVDPHALRESDQHKWPALAKLLDIDLRELEQKMLRRYRNTGEGGTPELVRWSLLKKNVEEDVYLQVDELDIKGVYGNRTYVRNYPHRELGAHIIGFINREGVAVQGVEKWLDFYLKGYSGWREGERDGRRRELAHFRTREIPASDGYDIELTIDIMIQNAIEKEIAAIVEEWNPKGVTIIVSEPESGEILGMASYPSYDPNLFEKYPIDNHRNRAISDVYEPGSTFKIVPIAAALNERLITPETLYDCSLDAVEYQGRTIKLPKNSTRRPYQEMTVREITMKSLNNGSALIGIQLGEKKLYEYSQAFGFGEATGFPLLGEVRGILHPVARWDGLTISRLPIGHAVSATPLQTHFAMSVIANRGVLMQPQILKRVVAQDGADIVRVNTVSRRRVITTETARSMAEMLVDVVSQEGTGSKAIVRNFEVAGKTGTTQKLINGKYSSHHHVASFVGFFPASQPRLVISIVVDEPSGTSVGYGGSVAAPSFRRVAEYLIQYLRIATPDPSDQWVAQK
jgi:cell division protein FtsI/penicillin-binding protein 2